MQDSSAKLERVSPDELESGSAELDFATATAETPVSKYLIAQDFQTQMLYEAAVRKTLELCMAKAGQEFPIFSSVDWDSLEPPADRVFGMWQVDDAAKYGFEPRGSQQLPQPMLTDQGQAAVDAMAICQAKLEKDPILEGATEQFQKLSIADRIQGNAAEQALQSADGKSVARTFAKCLKKRGIVVDPESGYASGEYSSKGKEEEIKAAVAEAKCNIESGRIKTLYNLRARYEATLMKKYESQLNETKRQKKVLHDRLDKLVHGATAS